MVTQQEAERRLVEIEERLDGVLYLTAEYDGLQPVLEKDMPWLVAEVRRLHAERSEQTDATKEPNPPK